MFRVFRGLKSFQDEFKVKMTLAKKMVEDVCRKFQTRNVYEIAEKTGVSIIYERWFPVTVGEFDWRGKTICVNENAAIESEKIIAHELGHYFLREFEVKEIADEEKICDDFADELLKTNFHAEAQRTQR